MTELENMPEAERAKAYTGKPGRPKGVEILGTKNPGEKTGTATVGGAAITGVTIIDKTSKTESPPVEITHDEGDTGANEG